MYKEFEETFTNELRWRNEISYNSMDMLDDLIESTPQQAMTFSQEDIDLVWNTFDTLFGKRSIKYIMTYLVFYIGYSYRDAARTLGISVAWSHDLLANAIKAVQAHIQNERKSENLSE